MGKPKLEAIKFAAEIISSVAIIILLSGCKATDNTQQQKTLAEKYFRGVYGSDSTVVDELCTDDIVVSYPIIQQLFNKPAIRGRDAVRHFASGFSNRWSDTKIKFHEAIAESNKVVLVWSFQGRNIGSPSPDVQPTEKVKSWGGITLIRFNKAGKIVAEIGEESEPGPFERLK